MRLALVCVLALGLVVFAVAAVQAAEPIKVGAIVSATGPASYLGDPMAKTLRLQVERINREGGVNGRQLKLFLYDDGTDTKQAVSFARKLIDQDKVDVIFGGSITGTTMAVVPLVEEAQIPLISLAGGTVIIEPVKKWVFKTVHTDRMAVEKDYMDMQKRKINKIALIGGSVGYDEGCRKEAKSLASKYGITVVADETYAPADTDLTPQLTKIRENKEVQALLSCGSQAPTVITARNYQRLGMTKIPLYYTHAVTSQEFIDSAGNAAEGAYVPTAAVLVAEQLPNKDPQKSVSLAYRKEYEAAYNAPISAFGANANDALLLYVTAVKKAGTTDKAKVRDAIEQVKSLAGTNGVYNMSSGNHMGLDTTAFRMVQVHNGKWKLLY
jgi:branched-chain amino acid transport system substrate-binding protein